MVDDSNVNGEGTKPDVSEGQNGQIINETAASLEQVQKKPSIKLSVLIRKISQSLQRDLVALVSNLSSKGDKDRKNLIKAELNRSKETLRRLSKIMSWIPHKDVIEKTEAVTKQFKRYQDGFDLVTGSLMQLHNSMAIKMEPPYGVSRALQVLGGRYDYFPSCLPRDFPINEKLSETECSDVLEQMNRQIKLELLSTSFPPFVKVESATISNGHLKLKAQTFRMSLTLMYEPRCGCMLWVIRDLEITAAALINVGTKHPVKRSEIKKLIRNIHQDIVNYMCIEGADKSKVFRMIFAQIQDMIFDWALQTLASQVQSLKNSKYQDVIFDVSVKPEENHLTIQYWKPENHSRLGYYKHASKLEIYIDKPARNTVSVDKDGKIKKTADTTKSPQPSTIKTENTTNILGDVFAGTGFLEEDDDNDKMETDQPEATTTSNADDEDDSSKWTQYSFPAEQPAKFVFKHDPPLRPNHQLPTIIGPQSDMVIYYVDKLMISIDWKLLDFHQIFSQIMLFNKTTRLYQFVCDHHEAFFLTKEDPSQLVISQLRHGGQQERAGEQVCLDTELTWVMAGLDSYKFSVVSDGYVQIKVANSAPDGFVTKQNELLCDKYNQVAQVVQSLRMQLVKGLLKKNFETLDCEVLDKTHPRFIKPPDCSAFLIIRMMVLQSVGFPLHIGASLELREPFRSLADIEVRSMTLFYKPGLFYATNGSCRLEQNSVKEGLATHLGPAFDVSLSAQSIRKWAATTHAFLHASSLSRLSEFLRTMILKPARSVLGMSIKVNSMRYIQFELKADTGIKTIGSGKPLARWLKFHPDDYFYGNKEDKIQSYLYAKRSLKSCLPGFLQNYKQATQTLSVIRSCHKVISQMPHYSFMHLTAVSITLKWEKKGKSLLVMITPRMKTELVLEYSFYPSLPITSFFTPHKDESAVKMNLEKLDQNAELIIDLHSLWSGRSELASVTNKVHIPELTCIPIDLDRWVLVCKRSYFFEIFQGTHPRNNVPILCLYDLVAGVIRVNRIPLGECHSLSPKLAEDLSRDKFMKSYGEGFYHLWTHSQPLIQILDFIFQYLECKCALRKLHSAFSRVDFISQIVELSEHHLRFESTPRTGATPVLFEVKLKKTGGKRRYELEIDVEKAPPKLLEIFNAKKRQSKITARFIKAALMAFVKAEILKVFWHLLKETPPMKPVKSKHELLFSTMELTRRHNSFQYEFVIRFTDPTNPFNFHDVTIKVFENQASLVNPITRVPGRDAETNVLLRDLFTRNVAEIRTLTR